MVSFFSQVNVLPVEEEDLDRFDPEGLSFFNINRPQDLIRAEAMVSEV
jgi:molybdopterin-guanine dinucleotide biosynthesis protein A